MSRDLQGDVCGHLPLDLRVRDHRADALLHLPVELPRAVTTSTVLSAPAVAGLIAARVADPEILAEAVAATARQSRYASVLPWRPPSLALGRAGVAVLCAEMDRREPGEGWDRIGHRHLSIA